MEIGLAMRPITDWEAYNHKLRQLMGSDNKMMRRFVEQARSNPKRVVFGEANTDNTLRAAVSARNQGICVPILLGNEEMIAKRAERLGLDISGIEIVNLRHDREADRRNRFATKLARKRQRSGLTYREALEKMFDRNYFGMMMVDEGEADAFIAGTYSGSDAATQIAKEVIGIRPSYKHFATLHILNTKRGTYFLADTMINQTNDEETLLDVARLARNSVEYFAHEPVMAMVSYSNFGASNDPECSTVHKVVDKMQQLYPDLPIDGEMQVNYALNRDDRDAAFPFSRLNGKDVNTLIFPNLSAANTAYRMMLEMGLGDAIGPIQMGLNKPVHFIGVDSPVRDIINLVTIAVLDAAVLEKVTSQAGSLSDK
jgi:malate dehydrogenase (oxaloacetate-decarboxylating)(NADP+)